jgi:toxin-antitoxin system PIN domain toxin
VILVDVNVIVYAHGEDAPDHRAYLGWRTGAVDSEAPYAVSELVLSGFVRVVTHPRVFSTPTPMKDALAFAETLRGQPNCVRIAPGPRHWEIFARPCRTAGVRGNLVPDAYAALATSRAASGSRRTATTPASQACAGGTRSRSVPELALRVVGGTL